MPFTIKNASLKKMTRKLRYIDAKKLMNSSLVKRKNKIRKHKFCNHYFKRIIRAADVYFSQLFPKSEHSLKFTAQMQFDCVCIDPS